MIAIKRKTNKISQAAIPCKFFEQHELPLAQVFNRHKKLILAAKNDDTKTAINRISRLSKTKHVPIKESINKTFIAKALKKDIDFDILNKIGLRDKFKYLNLLAYKRRQLDIDAFVIRNGKVHFKTNRKIWDINDISRVENAVIASLTTDLAHLNNQKILLDNKIFYGLPISRKQTIGRLPYGTKVIINEGQLSSGIYWENKWGATDLDLSTIDVSGNRTGWGSWSGYNKTNPIKFSGDITNAPKGAMEFMTSLDQDYGLFVSIYWGDVGCDMEIVVGEDSSDSKWINNPLIREKMTLDSRNNVIGFVQSNIFTIYSGRLGGNRVSSNGENPMVARGMSSVWTINELFDKINVKYDLDKCEETNYNSDLTYENFSYDKLEDLLLTE